MDADRFDALTRLLTSPRSRRSLTRGGVAFAVVLAGAAQSAAGACGPCERKTRRGCKPRKDNTICRAGGCCRDGRCFGPPACIGFDQSCAGNAGGCCAGPGACGTGDVCGKGGRGSRCYGDQDCANGRICVGYRCK